MKVLLLTLLMFGCATTYTPEEIAAESKKVNAYFEKDFQDTLNLYPTYQTYLGLKTNYGKLNNNTEAFREKMHERTKELLDGLKQFNRNALDETTRVSFDIYKRNLEREIEGYKYKYHWFPVNQMFGYHSGTPSFLINMHTIENEQQARDYISRMKEIKRVFDENMVTLKKQKELGINPPKFSLPKVIDDSKNIVTGRPFTKKGDSPLLEDFKNKLKKIKIKSSTKKSLIKEAELALTEYVKPAYDELITYITDLEKSVTTNHGAWSLPDGEDFYNFRLKGSTTTDLTAAQIHEIGLSEVERIHNEMRTIIKRVGSKKSLQEFFEFMKTDKRFYYPDSQKGRKQYIKDTNRIVADMKKALPQMFKTFPKAELIVKPVEKYREKSAGLAFYQGPSMFGDRPGIYYVNMYKMDSVSNYQMEALAYHEAIPGHHMQNAIQTELTELPKFRRTAHFTAYGEGWGLYSEYLPKEYGFYQDPYSDFGRLAMELWRACRLVVDTGLHYKKWSREEAIKYLRDNSPNSDTEVRKAIERYIVMPGQATAYKIGMMKILELRENAKTKLGNKFDIRDFHDVILRNGSIPLDILEDQVARYISRSL
jgi:uncharacterized protein (DUF885 family)